MPNHEATEILRNSAPFLGAVSNAKTASNKNIIDNIRIIINWLLRSINEEYRNITPIPHHIIEVACHANLTTFFASRSFFLSQIVVNFEFF